MKSVFVLIVFISAYSFSQNNYINSDGTLSRQAKRELLLNALNEKTGNSTRYKIEDNNLIVITLEDCGDNEYEPEEIQKKAMYSSFGQLKEQINSFQVAGFKVLEELDLDGIIFKTNTICMLKTRRYHFKFSLEELNQFPEYMDILELIEYVAVTKENKNIILVKNNQ
jgi:hypothetical protein